MSDTGLFANESVPYAPFKVVGTTYQGTVIRTGKQQQTSYVSKKQREAGKQGEPLWWEKPTATSAGRPKWVYIITIQTDLRDPDIPGDDGQRSIWVSGKQMEDAVKKAVKESGASKDGILPGGFFGMKFTHETPTESDGEEVSATKHYAVTYRPPEPRTTEIVAGPASDDPWAQPQNAFPQADPWGNSPMPGVGHPAPQQPYKYDNGGLVGPGSTVQPQPVQQPPVGGLDTNATPASVANALGGGQMDLSALPPEARALVEKMYADQQGGAQ